MDFFLMTKYKSNDFSTYISLPNEIIENLISSGEEPPFYFKINGTRGDYAYVGVKDFNSQDNFIEMPEWLGTRLYIHEMSYVNIELVKNIPKGKTITVSPLEKDFFKIKDYDKKLEPIFSNIPLMFNNLVLPVNIEDRIYNLHIEDVEIDYDLLQGFEYDKVNFDGVIDVVNIDLNVNINNKFLKEMEEEEKQKQLLKKTFIPHQKEEKEEPKGRTIGDKNEELSKEELRERRLRALTGK